MGWNHWVLPSATSSEISSRHLWHQRSGTSLPTSREGGSASGARAGQLPPRGKGGGGAGSNGYLATERPRDSGKRSLLTNGLPHCCTNRWGGHRRSGTSCLEELEGHSGQFGSIWLL